VCSRARECVHSYRDAALPFLLERTMNEQYWKGQQRSMMWEELIPGISAHKKKEREKLKKHYAMNLGLKPYQVHTEKELKNMYDVCQSGTVSSLEAEKIFKSRLPELYFDCCKSVPVNTPEHKEKNMRYDNTVSIAVAPAPDAGNQTEKEQRRYLRSRLWSISSDKVEDFYKVFRLNDDAQPQTIKELKDRLASGMFVIRGEDTDKIVGWNSGVNYIRWRDPAKPEDQDGYDAAMKKLDEARQKAEDEITILPPEKGLEAVRAFEGTTFH